MAAELEKDRPEIQVDRVIADALRPETYPRTVEQLCEEVIKLRKEVDHLQKEGFPGSRHETLLERDAIISYLNACSLANTWPNLPTTSPIWFHRHLLSEKEIETGKWLEQQPPVAFGIHGYKTNPQRESEPPEMKIRELEAKIYFLENQLQNDKPHLQLYKLGTGSLLMAVASLALWAVVGIAAPFHPIFAAVTIPASLGVTAMAILISREAHTKHDAS